MKILIKKELVLILGIFFLVCGGAIELLLTNRGVENDSLNMIFFFCSTACFMISAFIFAFILAKSVCDIAHKNIKIAWGAAVMAACLIPVLRFMHSNVENEKTDMIPDTITDMVTITPMDLGSRYDEAVVPAVTVKRDNDGVDLDIQLSYDPNFNENAVGYLGNAYYIISSQLQEARLTFTYDESLLKNRIGDGFTPTIYCMHNQTDYYPLPDQSWENNTVSATITDFDRDHMYMLIDGNAYLQWQEEYTDFWRQYEEEHPGELERMMRSQEELDAESENQ